MAMYQSHEIPHLSNETIGRHLIELMHGLGEVNGKLDRILSLLTVDQTPGLRNPPAPTCLDQTQTTQNVPLGLEDSFNAPGTHLNPQV